MYMHFFETNLLLQFIHFLSFALALQHHNNNQTLSIQEKKPSSIPLSVQQHIQKAACRLHKFPHQPHKLSRPSSSGTTAHQQPGDAAAAGADAAGRAAEEVHGHACGGGDGVLFCALLDVALGGVLVEEGCCVGHCLAYEGVVGDASYKGVRI